REQPFQVQGDRLAPFLDHARWLRGRVGVRLWCIRGGPALLRSRHRETDRGESPAVAIGQPKIRSMGAAQILLLIATPFALAVFYAFSDARIGSTTLHFVGLENFRSILNSPSFHQAVQNSIVFTVCAQVIVVVCSTMLSLALEKPFRGRGVVRFLILLPWVAPVSLGSIGWKWILDSIYSVITWVLVWMHFFTIYNAPMWLGQPHLAMASVVCVHCWRLI